jgi:beta-mannanase
MVTWEPRNWLDPGQRFPLGAIASGAYDGYLRESAQAAAAWHHPILVRFAHEMNGGWYPWGTGVKGNSPRVYVAAWRHVVQIFREEGATNVRWVWTPYVENGDRFPFMRYFPGNAWVDWIGLDGLNGGGVFGWRPFAKIFSASYRDLTRLSSRPVMLAEVGTGEEGGDKAAWVRGALRRVIPQFGHVKAVVWFNERFHGIDPRVYSSHRALNAFRSAAASPRYSLSRRQLLAIPDGFARAKP